MTDGRRINDEPNPKGKQWGKPLSDRELDALGKLARGGGGGGSSRSGGLYQTAMLAMIPIVVLLGWRIVSELGHIRRALTGAP